MRVLPFFFLVFASLLLPTIGARAEPPPAVVSGEEVLRKAIEARGGRDAFQRVRSFCARGSVSFYTASGPWWGAASVTKVWPFELLAARPDKFRFITNLKSTAGASFAFVPFRYFENGFDGRSAWEVLPGPPAQRLGGIWAQERREQAGFFAWCAEAQDYGSVINLGETDFDNRRCYELRLVSKSGRVETQYYDLNNHLLAGIVRSSVFGPSLERSAFGNYREFGGFQFPTRVTYMNAVEQIDSIEVNGVNESAFTMPVPATRPSVPRPSESNSSCEADIKAMLQDWIDSEKLVKGVAVGVLDAHGRHVVCHGRCSPWHDDVVGTIGGGIGRLCGVPDPRVNPDTVFPLASISKVFTRLLLLDMVERGEMRLDDPAQQYLPASVRLPIRNGKQITLLHLATHTSGLPRYMGGSLEEVSSSLSRFELSREPGAEFEYSNTGAGLLGKAIERKAGRPYRQLVAERICRPLGMTHTRVRICPLPGVDGIESTANDLLTFSSACLGLIPAPPALSRLIQHLYATHGGDSSRFALDLVVDRVHLRALVSLASTDGHAYGLARESLKHLIMNPSLRPPAVADINYAGCDDYVGQYLMDNNSVWSVRRTGSHLLLQEVGRESHEVFPTSQTAFANRMIELDAAFTPAVSGQPVRLILHQSSNPDLSGLRICAQAPVRGVTAKLSQWMLDDCIGQYKGSCGQAINIRREEKRLIVESLADWNMQELVAESETQFCSPVDPALVLTILRDNDGHVTGLIYHYGPAHTRYAKTDSAPPVITQADMDRFLGAWESASAQSKPVVLKIFKSGGSYRATVDLIDQTIKDYRFKSVAFLGPSSLLLRGSIGEDQVKVGAALNDTGTEMSGVWRRGQRLSPVTFKRAKPGPQANK